MNPFHQFSHFIFIGYTAIAIPVLIAYLFVKAKRPFLSRMMILPNWILLLGSCVYLIATLIYILTVYNDGENHAALLTRLFGPYWFGYWGLVLFKGILPQILWLKKLRENIGTTLVLLLLIRFDYYFTFFIIWMTNQHRDYLPSSRVFYGPKLSEILFAILLSASLLVIFYYVAKRKKLDASAFSKE